MASGEETIEQDSLDEKVPFQVHSDIPSMPDLVWTGNGDIELQKVFKDEGVESAVPRDQIIYVNAEDVVASDPAEQYIVIEHGCDKLMEGDIPVELPPSLQYAIASGDLNVVSKDAPEMRVSLPARQVVLDPPRHFVHPADQIRSISSKALPSSIATTSYKSTPRSSSSSSSDSLPAKSQRTFLRKVAPKPKKHRALKRKHPGNPPGASYCESEPEGEHSKDVQCTLCKTYTFDLKSHLKLHCDVCNVFMRDPELLKTHKLNHTKSSGHCSCGICGEKFASSDLLRGHLQINGYHRYPLPVKPLKSVSSKTVFKPAGKQGPTTQARKGLTDIDIDTW